MWLVRALRTARRKGLWDVRPMAMHDLFCLAVHGHHRDEAEGWARRAFRAIRPAAPPAGGAGARHRALLAERRPPPRRAAGVPRGAAAHRAHPRTAAGDVEHGQRGRRELGDRLAFANMWQETWRLIDEHEDTEAVPNALVTLAEGAAMLGATPTAGNGGQPRAEGGDPAQGERAPARRRARAGVAADGADGGDHQPRAPRRRARSGRRRGRPTSFRTWWTPSTAR